MKHLLILGSCVALLVGVVLPAGADDSSSAVMSTLPTGSPGGESTCTATATCRNGTTVQCSGNTTCVAVDANCPTQAGYVECDGSRTSCVACCTTQACTTDSQCYKYCSITIGVWDGTCWHGCCNCYI